ncbi:MAG: hypothetical protein RLZZ248_593 [Bacteroidota bacterium]|jgi:hypothetical protein
MLAILFVAILVFIEFKYVRIVSEEKQVMEPKSDLVKEAA